MQTFQRLVNVFNTVFEDEMDAKAVRLDADLREDMGINSIGMLYLAMAVEEEFGIKFSNEDFTGIRTVEDVVRCIEGKL
jgi:acyl carrier protein